MRPPKNRFLAFSVCAPLIILAAVYFERPGQAFATPPTPQTAATNTVSPSATATAKKVHPVHHIVRRRRIIHHAARRAGARRHTVVRRRVVRRRVVRRRVARRAVVHHGARRTAASSKARHIVRRAPVRRTVHSAHYRHVSYSHAPTRHVVYHHAVYHHVVWSPWTVSSYSDPTLGDSADGEVASVRAAAVKALGRWNGSIVVVDPNTGRVLTIVNQKLALARGFIPCSTVKPMVALAGLNQGVISLNTKLMGMFGRRVDLTQALAHSDNHYFAEVGEMLGFNRVREFAEELGYGQRAGLDIAGESPGVFPSQPPPKSIGGVGKLTSFGTDIDQTPLQMAALVSAIANGGTLYWLQYPRTTEEAADFTPRVRRVLTNLVPYIPEVRQGMAAAVLYGTARSAYNPEEDLFGKTGTCSEDGGRMGWFVSYSQEEHPKYVVVVMLRGGRPMFGPHAAAIGGVLYRSLLPSAAEPVQGARMARVPEPARRAGE